MRWLWRLIPHQHEVTLPDGIAMHGWGRPPYRPAVKIGDDRTCNCDNCTSLPCRRCGR